MRRGKLNLLMNGVLDGGKALKISVFIIMSYCTEMFNSTKLELGHRKLERFTQIFLSFSPGFQNKNRVAILAELDKEKRKLLMQNQSSTNHPGASIALARSPLNKDFRDHAEQQHIAAQQKAALQHAHAHSSGYFITQDSAFGNLILPVLPRLEAE
uniref:SOSS complex subunit C n=63 Tax=Aves TaxID=8782 RepID=A0A3Q2TZP9_CHICK